MDKAEPLHIIFRVLETAVGNRRWNAYLPIFCAKDLDHTSHLLVLDVTWNSMMNNLTSKMSRALPNKDTQCLLNTMVKQCVYRTQCMIKWTDLPLLPGAVATLLLFLLFLVMLFLSLELVNLLPGCCCLLVKEPKDICRTRRLWHHFCA